MAARKKAVRRKKATRKGGKGGRSYTCKVCGYKGTGPTVLSKHYKEHPDHVPKHLQYKWNSLARKAGASGRKKAVRRAGGLPTKPKPGRSDATRIPKKTDLAFCTNCGTKARATWRFCGGCGARRQ